DGRLSARANPLPQCPLNPGRFGTVARLLEDRVKSRRPEDAEAMKRAIPALVWLAAGATLAFVTSHVRDWFVMTDELLYERLAISVVRMHTAIPQVHGTTIDNINQLYPLLLTPVFAIGNVGSDVQNAHILNAFVMTFAAVPTGLLAQRLTGSRLLSFVSAALTVVVPWMALSSFLLTEVVAYPAFAWALYASYVAI